MAQHLVHQRSNLFGPFHIHHLHADAELPEQLDHGHAAAVLADRVFPGHQKHRHLPVPEVVDVLCEPAAAVLLIAKHRGHGARRVLVPGHHERDPVDERHEILHRKHGGAYDQPLDAQGD